MCNLLQKSILKPPKNIILIFVKEERKNCFWNVKLNFKTLNLKLHFSLKNKTKEIKKTYLTVEAAKCD
jgi:hypothetical protein